MIFTLFDYNNIMCCGCSWSLTTLKEKNRCHTNIQRFRTKICTI